MNKMNRPKAKGQTLIEIMIGLGLLGFASLAVVQIIQISGSARRAITNTADYAGIIEQINSIVSLESYCRPSIAGPLLIGGVPPANAQNVNPTKIQNNEIIFYQSDGSAYNYTTQFVTNYTVPLFKAGMIVNSWLIEHLYLKPNGPVVAEMNLKNPDPGISPNYFYWTFPATLTVTLQQIPQVGAAGYSNPSPVPSPSFSAYNVERFTTNIQMQIVINQLDQIVSCGPVSYGNDLIAAPPCTSAELLMSTGTQLSCIEVNCPVTNPNMNGWDSSGNVICGPAPSPQLSCFCGPGSTATILTAYPGTNTPCGTQTDSYGNSLTLYYNNCTRTQ